MAINIYPRSTITDREVIQLRQSAADNVQELARATNNITDLTYRQFRGNDLTLNGGTQLSRVFNPNALVQNVYLTDQFPNCTTKVNQAFVLFGYSVLAAAPVIDEITIYIGNNLIAVLPLGQLYAQGGVEAKDGYIFDPIYVPPQTHFRIDLVTGVAAGLAANTEAFMPLGYVGEKFGDTVNKAANQPEGIVSAASVAG